MFEDFEKAKMEIIYLDFVDIITTSETLDSELDGDEIDFDW